MNLHSLVPLAPDMLRAAALAPACLMAAAAAACAALPRADDAALWRRWIACCAAGLGFAVVVLAACLGGVHARQGGPAWPLAPGLALSRLGPWMALLVQFLGTVIGAFSSRYLQGEPRQRRYAAALAAVLAGVQLLLLADHWLVLIVAWYLIGAALHRLLCFYPERPFARLAAHKKRIADRLADLLLLAAAALAWHHVGSGSLSALFRQVQAGDTAPALRLAALLLVLAVMVRTALLPVHGWLIQVMEAPTPVSALLHAGVVNLGGFVLIRFAPLLGAAEGARALLVAGGLASALLAGMVSLTRVSIKVRLAWSTVAQMGFMMLECGLGLYELAALHLLGHSLYKAHAFLSASGVVRDARLRALRDLRANSAASVLAAPWLAAGVLLALDRLAGGAPWPWWWSGVLAAAWAPLLWWPAWRPGEAGVAAWRAANGIALVAALVAAATVAHLLPLGTRDVPWQAAGPVAWLGMAGLYLMLAALQLAPRHLETVRRWSYAGFYVDEIYTRAALRLWPARWGGPHRADSTNQCLVANWSTP
ncbi:NADH-quinone oxidoreductase subunit L [Thiomonas sp.]|uniref:NADH-quinone oxidoreductase subunit L n=1 Tax=Thiomonas sp. TaxID=2047785 RepID=UPI002614A91B|nr:NADH-quinone oxidoreductase subunit L [Thiomonas sp.]